MVEIRENNNQMQENTTPETITTSMILEDLENGVDRTGIKAKYNLETWEVKQMFDHPVLKGKKAKRVKKLSFNFVDDTVNTDVLPGQVDLEDAIEEELNGRKQMDAEDQLQEMDEFITDEIGREVIEEADTEELESRADDWSSENNY
jgi:hypothetical protein